MEFKKFLELLEMWVSQKRRKQFSNAYWLMIGC